MSEQSVTPKQTVEEALASGIEARRGAASPWSEQLRELGSLDRAVYQAIADTPTPGLDSAFRRLSTAANQSRLWLGLAAAMALLGGSRGRRAALDGVVAIGATSATVNLGIKPLARRRRPFRVEPEQFEGRHVPMPTSTSFPSGHAASAFAFASAVSQELPRIAVPIGLLAGAVAYSRVHTGVHYPGDVVIGSIIGAGTAATLSGHRRAHSGAAGSGELGRRRPRQPDVPPLPLQGRGGWGARMATRDPDT
jgi:undecaprenyl-diphosphatase